MDGELLVLITTGIENPTKLALGLLVARTALESGARVNVFLAGDAVTALRVPTATAANGIGTGSVAEHLGALRDGGAGLYASGMSAAARGLDAEAVGASGFVPSPPARLVELTFAADRVLTF
jgi:uncharacterized protein